jgi:hypothetical protein
MFSKREVKDNKIYKSQNMNIEKNKEINKIIIL